MKSFVLQAVSDKTGYPVEMLDLDLDLEADLGIDTVKQAELFATIRTHFDIPRREDLRLADYNTLTKVIGFMRDALAQKSPAAASEPAQAVVAPAAPVEISASRTAPVAPIAPQTASVDEAEVKDFVLQAVSDKTGYPVEMLDLELDLEADLGIDTVKQAELFATIRTHFDIPRREDLRLADYNNLAKVIGFMHEALTAGNGAGGEVKTAGGVATPVEEAVQAAGRVEQLLQDEVNQVISRRMPAPVLRPRLDLCTPSGVELGEGSRVFVVGDHGKTGEALAKRLRGRKVEVMVVSGADPDEVERKAVEFLGHGEVDGVYFLTSLDAELSLEQLSQEAWKMEIERRSTALYRLMRAIPGEPFLVSATRMGGLFGYEPDGATAPLGGLVSGFTKALAWSAQVCWRKWSISSYMQARQTFHPGWWQKPCMTRRWLRWVGKMPCAFRSHWSNSRQLKQISN